MLWNLLLGLILIGAAKYGDYITDECPQASYSCPSICDVDHKHLPIKECKNARSRKKKVFLYKEGEKSREGIRKENREKDDTQEEVLTEE